MFRCITNLKGIAIDLDSFGDVPIEEWNKLNDVVPCYFMTTDTENTELFSRSFGEKNVAKLHRFERIFSPNRTTHIRVLEALGIKNTELAYLSCNHSFLENASGFLSGTIWITEEVSYQQASKAPDLIRKTLPDLINALEDKLMGYYGEMYIFPNKEYPATMLSVDLKIDNQDISMYVLGRYFGYSHYMSQLHPYSSAIYLNKKPNKSYTGVLDTSIRNIYFAAIKTLQEMYTFDAICSVPVKPGKKQRFSHIIENLATDLNLANIGENFLCIRDYPDQKSLSTEEREKNVKGAFSYNGNLNEQTIVLIDDIISTGSTIKECIRELKRKGAKEVVVVVLAINQFDTGTYWSSEMPQVTCPKCGGKMTLLLNRQGGFFYSCIECYTSRDDSVTTGFDMGWAQMCHNENSKFEELISERKSKNETKETENGINLNRRIRCPYCAFDNIIDFRDYCTISVSERPMGPEILHEINMNYKCEHCSNSMHLDGYISEYPINAVDAEEISIDKTIQE